MENQELESGKKGRIRRAFSYSEPETYANDKKSDVTEDSVLNFEKKEPMYSTTISFRVEAKLADRLDKLARELRWTKSEILVELLKRALPSLEKQHGLKD